MDTMSDPFANGQWSVYNPAPGTDPTWDAFLATYTAKAQMAALDAQRQRDLLMASHGAAKSTLDEQSPRQRKELEASLLARGIGRSGTAMRGRTDLESDITRMYQSAEDSYRAGNESIDSTYARALADMAAEREGQIAESRLRLLGGNKTVPGATTGGGTTSGGYSKPKVKPKSTTGGGGSSGGKGNSVTNPSPTPKVQKPFVVIPPPKSPYKNTTGGGRYNY